MNLINIISPFAASTSEPGRNPNLSMIQRQIEHYPRSHLEWTSGLGSERAGTPTCQWHNSELNNIQGTICSGLQRHKRKVRCREAGWCLVTCQMSGGQRPLETIQLGDYI